MGWRGYRNAVFSLGAAWHGRSNTVHDRRLWCCWASHPGGSHHRWPVVSCDRIPSKLKGSIRTLIRININYYVRRLACSNYPIFLFCSRSGCLLRFPGCSGSKVTKLRDCSLLYGCLQFLHLVFTSNCRAFWLRESNHDCRQLALCRYFCVHHNVHRSRSDIYGVSVRQTEATAGARRKEPRFGRWRHASPLGSSHVLARKLTGNSGDSIPIVYLANR
jgi:hypothetical protein